MGVDMRYGFLRFISILIRFTAILAVIGCIALFVFSFARVHRQLDLLSQVQVSSQQDLQSIAGNLQALQGMLDQLSSVTGVPFPTQTIATLPTVSTELLQWRIDELMAQPFITLFVDLIACLVLYGFGGLISVVIDIATPHMETNFERYSQIDNGDPVTPKPWASFPDYSKQKTPIRPSGDERARIPRGKRDMGH